MLIRKLEVGSFAANCYLVACEESREGVLIDPGAEGKKILAWVEQENVNVKYIINTHGHPDHVGANKSVRQALGALLLIHEADSEMSQAHEVSAYFGNEAPQKPDRFIREGDKLNVGSLIFQVIETPGHSMGSVTIAVNNVLFAGDTLFAGSIGRTDLPGGSFEEIIESIKTKLLIYPGDTVVYPGHGPQTTIEEEKNYNPFLR